jgi:hypothetical protein
MTIIKQYIAIIGLDSGQKPRGARFEMTDAEAARKAAQLMELRTAIGKNDEQKALINKLTDGKIFASQKGLVPLIKRPFYDLLIQKLELEPAAKLEPAKEPAPEKKQLPQAWLELKIGSVVVAPEKNPSEDGHWPCVITAIKGDQLTLRWIDNPKQKPVTMPRSAVAILAPSNAK